MVVNTIPDKLLHIEHSDGTKEYILESRLSTMNHTVLSSIDLTDPNQQLIFTTTDGEVLTISLEELVGLMEDLPPGSTFAGYDPFYIPMVVPVNTPTPNFVFYIYDHLGNTRITYSTAVACDASVTYTLEAVIDYYPYGKVLREYSNGQQEKYLSTQHERDLETGLDYRGARFYDEDLGRFLSLDPAAADYPSLSDYVYVVGNPIIYIDPDGKDAIISIRPSTEQGKNGSIIVNIVYNVKGEVDNDALNSLTQSFQGTWGNGPVKEQKISNGMFFKGNSFKNIDIDGQTYDVTYNLVIKEHEIDKDNPNRGLNLPEGQNLLEIIPNDSEETSNYSEAVLKYKPEQEKVLENTTFGHENIHVMGVGHNQNLKDENGNSSLSSYKTGRTVINQDILFTVEEAVRLAQGQRATVTLETWRGTSDQNTLRLKNNTGGTTRSTTYQVEDDEHRE